MRDRDGILLESLYLSIYEEGRKEVEQQLRNKNIPEDVIKAFIEADKTSSKADSIFLGKYYLEDPTEERKDEILDRYNQFISFKNRGIREASSLGALRDENGENTFAALEGLIGNLISKRGSGKQSPSSGSVNNHNVVFEDDTVKIFYAKNIFDSIAFSNHNYGPHSWCIGYELNSGATNMFPNYRLNQRSTIYFVRIKNRAENPKEDKWGYFVLQAKDDGMYYMTSGLNDGDKTYSWDDVVAQVPELKPYKKYVESKGFTPEEEKKLNNFINLRRNFDEDVFLSIPRDQQQEYLVCGYPITPQAFDRLFTEVHQGKKLANDYVNSAFPIEDKYTQNWTKVLEKHGMLEQYNKKRMELVRRYFESTNDY